MKGGSGGTHRGWLRFQFSYCNENCISINCCSRKYLAAVTRDSISPWVMWRVPLPPGMAAEVSAHYHFPHNTGDAADEQRWRFCVSEKKESQYTISWWLKKWLLLPSFFCDLPLPDLNLWFSACILQAASIRSVITTNSVIFLVPTMC